MKKHRDRARRREQVIRDRDEMRALRIEEKRLRVALLAPKVEAAKLDAARRKSIRLHLEKDIASFERESRIRAISENIRDRVMYDLDPVEATGVKP